MARQLAREKARPKGSRGRSNRESGARSASGNTAVAEGIQLIQIEATEELAKKNPRETTSLFERALIASANDVKRYTFLPFCLRRFRCAIKFLGTNKVSFPAFIATDVVLVICVEANTIKATRLPLKLTLTT